MHQPTEPMVKFYKLKSGENVVGYDMGENETSYKVRRPLSFTVESDVMSGRQMLDVKEWLPPIVCATDETHIPKEFVLLVTDVKPTFKEEFDEASKFLYNVEAVRKKSRKTADNVTMLRDPSTKPN